MGKRDAQFIMILDIDRIFSAEELTAVRGAEGARTAGGRKRLNRERGRFAAARFEPVMDTQNEILSGADFERLRGLIYTESGINLKLR